MKNLLFYVPIIICAQSHQLIDINSHETFSLIKQYQNKKAVVVNFWATWCAPCVEEFPGLVQIQKKFPEQLKVIFISFDMISKRKDVIHFLKKNNVDWTSYFKAEPDDTFISNMPEIWDGTLPFSMIFRQNGLPEIYLTGKQDFDTFLMYVNKAINNGSGI